MFPNLWLKKKALHERSQNPLQVTQKSQVKARQGVRHKQIEGAFVSNFLGAVCVFLAWFSMGPCPKER